MTGETPAFESYWDPPLSEPMTLTVGETLHYLKLMIQTIRYVSPVEFEKKVGVT